MIAKLQYISQGDHIAAIEAACVAGCDWIQLRVKNKPKQDILKIAKAAKQICEAYQAKLIINDYPSIANAVQAEGVHLGKSDKSPSEARCFSKKEIIIGGTANTIEDIKNYAKEGVVDYIGLGPFRYTTTKKNLSPILGLEGYQRIVEVCKKEQINIPLIAIGGILLEDISAILATGVHGIAVSGLITKAADKTALVEEIKKRCNGIAV